MTIVTFPPEVLPSSMSVNLVSNTKIYESNFNRDTTTHRFKGERWQMTLNFDNIDNFSVRQIDIMQSFLWGLNGANGRFYMGDFSKQGVATRGAPVVQGANQSGKLLVTSGWTPNTLVIPRGKYFQVGTELKFATEDLYSDSQGGSTLKFTPSLRTSPANGAAIITENPVGVFRLVDDSQGSFNLSAGLEGTVSIEVVEVFNYGQ